MILFIIVAFVVLVVEIRWFDKDLYPRWWRFWEW